MTSSGIIEGLVAIVGRPNVGKSTLFNRLTRSEEAIVDDRPGVTRDKIYGTVWLDADRERGFSIIDTGGFEKDDFKFQPFADNLVWKQTEAAIDEADLVVLVFDGKDGLNPHDRELVRYLTAREKPYMSVVNKIDGPEQAQAMWDFYELGDGELQKVSAAHNRGVGDLRDFIADKIASLPGRTPTESYEGATRIAIVGRPNAGKSSILNRLTGEERALVSEIAGTTRDTLDTPLLYNKEKFILVDTAGIRRKSKIDDRVESLSVMRAIKAIERADVVFLVLDAMHGLTEQDARLADLAVQRHKPLAIVVNKWDLVPEKTANTSRDYTANIARMAKTLSFAPVAFVSCLKNQRIHQLLGLAQRLFQTTSRRAETSKVNAAMRAMVQEHTPALIKGKTRRVKFYYSTQVAIRPPTFVVKCNVYEEIQESYIRYMTNRYRKDLGFEGVPIRLLFRPKNDDKTARIRDDLDDDAFEAALAPVEVDADSTEFVDMEPEHDDEGDTLLM